MLLEHEKVPILARTVSRVAHHVSRLMVCKTKWPPTHTMDFAQYTPLIRRALCISMLLTSTFACGGNGENGGDGGTDGGGGMLGEMDDAVRGTFVWIDGSETNFERRASYSRFSFGDDVQHSCLADDLGNRLSLGVSWTDDTEPGTIEVSAMGPYVAASWPHVDGQSIRATIPSQGAITFDSVGTQDGDIVSGSADVMLQPEADDPNDRVSQIVAIEFRCTVTEA